MILYHASPDIIEHPDTLHSRPNLDFGKGFYLTTLREQALQYAERFSRRGRMAYLNVYEYNEDTGSFRTKTFAGYDGDWLDYVAACRKGVWGGGEKYDAVQGGVANDKVFNTVDLYFAGLINREEALGRLRYEKPNHQICILSDDMIARCLNFIQAEKL